MSVYYATTSPWRKRVVWRDFCNNVEAWLVIWVYYLNSGRAATSRPKFLLYIPSKPLERQVFLNKWLPLLHNNGRSTISDATYDWQLILVTRSVRLRILLGLLVSPSWQRVVLNESAILSATSELLDSNSKSTTANLIYCLSWVSPVLKALHSSWYIESQIWSPHSAKFI